MKIAVFGAEGQLGSDLTIALSLHDVVPLNHSAVDITDRASVERSIAHTKPDFVVNAAAMTHVDRCESEDVAAFEVNALGARYIAASCRANDATLVHISTDYVFDGAKQAPYVESDATHPLNAYGITKLAGEFYVANEQPRHYIVRSSGLYGLHRTRGKGRNFVETMLELAEERDTLKVVSDERLTPTYTEDLAMQVCRIIETSPPHGLYHATNQGDCSWYEFATEILRLAGTRAKVEAITSAEWNAPATRPAYSVLDNTALQTAGIDAMPEWGDALTRYLTGKRAVKKGS